MEYTCFVDLKTLDLTHNQISELPTELGYMRSLEQLYIRHNKLRELPLLEHCGSLKVLIMIVVFSSENELPVIVRYFLISKTVQINLI